MRPRGSPWHHRDPPGQPGRQRGHHGLTLRRALFAASFFSILATAVVVIGIIAATSDDRAWWREMQRAQRFASAQLAAVWNDPPARDRMIRDAARELEVQIELRDVDGRVLVQAGPPGECWPWDADIEHNGVHYGSVRACRPGEHTPPWRGLLALAASLLVLWTIAGVVARRATRPLLSLVEVTRRIGEGDLKARPFARHRLVEIKTLSDAIGEMAERIEQQMKDQRALLAGASHELRTPLGHLRILVELLRSPSPSEAAQTKVIDDVEREVVEMDALVGKLLASARLDFSMADKREIDAADLARRALERVGEPVAKLVVQGSAATTFIGDPTLVLGAIGNLLENARTHGVSVVQLTVEPRADELVFVVDDAGAGIAADDEERVFEPFFHKDRRSSPSTGGDVSNGSLGLGLALVKRIAIAHGGRAFATTRAEGGGRVGFTVSRTSQQV